MSDQLAISLIQSTLHWEDSEANLAMFEEKIWQIPSPTDVIILPEMFSTGFTMNPAPVAEPMNSKTFRWMKLVASQKDALVIGSYIVQESGNYFNRLFCVFPDGSFHTYDKKHLFTLAGENKDYQPGADRLVVEWKGWKLMPLICYDLRFPVWARSQKSEDQLYEYDALIYVANWPTPRIKAWDTLLKARAIENIAYSVGVNRVGLDENNMEYSGHSAVYDYAGEEVVGLGEKEDISTAILEREKLEKFRHHFPFQVDSDRFKIF